MFLSEVLCNQIFSAILFLCSLRSSADLEDYYLENLFRSLLKFQGELGPLDFLVEFQVRSIQGKSCVLENGTLWKQSLEFKVGWKHDTIQNSLQKMLYPGSASQVSASNKNPKLIFQGNIDSCITNVDRHSRRSQKSFSRTLLRHPIDSPAPIIIALKMTPQKMNLAKIHDVPTVRFQKMPGNQLSVQRWFSRKIQCSRGPKSLDFLVEISARMEISKITTYLGRYSRPPSPPQGLMLSHAKGQ